MTEYRESPQEVVSTADGTKKTITGRGKTNILVNNRNQNEIREIKNVALVPDMNLNLLSVGEIVNKNMRVEFSSKGCEIRSVDRKTIHARGKRDGNLFLLDARAAIASFAGNEGATRT